MKINTAAGALCAALVASCWTQPAAAAGAFPERAVTLVVPFAPGGSVDIAARLISDAWGRALGQSVIVENRAGASGNIGMAAVARAEPNGYTLAINTMSLAINPRSSRTCRSTRRRTCVRWAPSGPPSTC
jgi:tripartite-type tricarboxylate transporter receptor subunit TctC